MNNITSSEITPDQLVDSSSARSIKNDCHFKALQCHSAGSRDQSAEAMEAFDSVDLKCSK